MRKLLFALFLSSTLAFGQSYPPDSTKDVAVGFGSGLLTNVCIEADQTLTTTGTIEEVLATCTIPANTFPASFAGVEIIATYIGAANANSKTMNVRVDGIAGTIVLEVTGDTDSADTYELSGFMTVGSGGSGNLSGSGTTTQGTGASTNERMRVTGLTFSSAIDVVFTGLTATSSGDVTLTSYMVRLMTGVTGDSGGHWNGGVFDNPALGPAGVVGAPGYAFSAQPTTGMFKLLDDYLSFSSDGLEMLRFRNQATVQGLFTITGGTTGNETHTISGSTTGSFSLTTQHVASSNRAQIITSSQSTSNTMEFRASQAGTNPTGLFIQANSPEQARLDVNGLGRFGAFDTYVETLGVPHRIDDGTVTAPGLAISSDLDHGIWHTGTSTYLSGLDTTQNDSAYVLVDGDGNFARLGMETPGGTGIVSSLAGSITLATGPAAAGITRVTVDSTNVTSTLPSLWPNAGYCFTTDNDACLQLLGVNNLRLTNATSDPEDLIQINTTAITIEAGEDDNSDYSTITVTEGVSINLDVEDNQGTGTNADLTLSAAADQFRVDVNDQTNDVVLDATPTAIIESFDTTIDRVFRPRAPVALTTAVATPVVQVGVTAGNAVGFTVNWTVQADDATDFQSRRGSTYVAAVNKATVETCTVGDIGTPIVAVSAGTLTVTTSCDTTPVNAVDFEIDAVSSLTETTLEVFYSVVKDDGFGSLTGQ